MEPEEHGYTLVFMEPDGQVRDGQMGFVVPKGVSAECNALFFKAIDHDSVVDNLVENKNLCPDATNRLVKAFDGHLHTCTKSPTAGEQHVHRVVW